MEAQNEKIKFIHSMKGQLIMLFLAISLIPLALVGFLLYNRANTALQEEAFAKLEVAQQIKKDQIENYFAERQGDMGVLVETVSTLREEAIAKLVAMREIKKSQIENYFEVMQGQLKILKDDPYVMQALVEFDEAFKAGGDRVDTAEWNAPARKYDSRLGNIMADNGWYDIFLIDTDGDIVYTVMGESDLGMVIPDSDLKNSSLGKAFQAAQTMGADEIAVADFAPYAPSNGEPAGFMMAQMRDERGALEGYVAFQIPLDKITAIMSERAGMGETGETYLVGPDKLMRSDSYLDPLNHSVAASFANPSEGSVETEAAKAALAGETAADVIIDYNGNPVLSAYTPLQIGDTTWALLAEIDVAEAFSPKDEAGEYFFAKYQQMYGYYDLFLINPDGYVFYTVAQEADHQTNMVNGAYSSSNLGNLVQEVLETKTFGFADFKPYEPSAGAPAAFIAQPVMHRDEVELIVALQLPLEGVNAIMSERAGMGETGETYLVGPDKLMRSDSYLAPEGHSVTASFAGTLEQNGVDTTASREALAGQPGEQIITDYNGNPVPLQLQPHRCLRDALGHHR